VLDIKTDDIYLLAYENGKGAIIKNKKEITNYEYQKIEKVELESLFMVEKAGKYGVLNMEGEEIISPEYEELYVEGVNIFANKNTENYIFDLNGNKLTSIVYSKKYKTQNENYFITINDEGLYGVEDKESNKIISNEYLYLEYAFENYFIVSNQDGKTGVIDKIIKM